MYKESLNVQEYSLMLPDLSRIVIKLQFILNHNPYFYFYL